MTKPEQDPDSTPSTPDDDIERRWPNGIEDIPNEFQTPERLRYEDDPKEES